MSLPNELVDSIVENLYSDRATLRNCALVGRAWVHYSQRGIFREIVLRLPISSEADYTTLSDVYLKVTGRLIALFDAKPHLATYVQSLALQKFMVPIPNQELHANFYITTASVKLYTATADVIQRLSSVKNLSFSSVYWDCIPPFFQATLSSLFRVPSLTQVSFAHFHIPTFLELASLLSDVKNLKVLKVEAKLLYTGVDDVPDDSILESEETPRSIQLTELELLEVHHFISWFQQDSCPFEVRHLQSLTVGGLDFLKTIALVQHVGRNLRELRLMNLQQIDLNNYLEYTPNLQVLHLGHLFQMDSSTPVPIIQSLFRPLLQQDGNEFPLQRLTIDLTILMRSNPLQIDHWDEWTAIDTLLLRPEFAPLKTVGFKLGPLAPYKGVVEFFSGKLPFLVGAGKLVVA